MIAKGPPLSESLRAKIESGEALIGVIGLGYVGLPLAAAMHGAGYRVRGFDVDPAKIDSLARGENYLRHLGNEMTRVLAASDRFDATAERKELHQQQRAGPTEQDPPPQARRRAGGHKPGVQHEQQRDDRQGITHLADAKRVDRKQQDAQLFEGQRGAP